MYQVYNEFFDDMENLAIRYKMTNERNFINHKSDEKSSVQPCED